MKQYYLSNKIEKTPDILMFYIISMQALLTRFSSLVVMLLSFSLQTKTSSFTAFEKGEIVLLL